jgi:hypothetical protein
VPSHSCFSRGYPRSRSTGIGDDGAFDVILPLGDTAFGAVACYCFGGVTSCSMEFTAEMSSHV